MWPSRQLSTEENNAALPPETALISACVKYEVVVLPFGAGDADDRELVLRISVERGGQQAHRLYVRR